MSNKRENDHPVLSARTGHVRRFATRLSWLVLDRAVSKAVQSVERRSPQHACLLRDIGLGPGEAERLASELHVLAADPDRISLKANSPSQSRDPDDRTFL
jgi:hypothetical protein